MIQLFRNTKDVIVWTVIFTVIICLIFYYRIPLEEWFPFAPIIGMDEIMDESPAMLFLKLQPVIVVALVCAGAFLMLRKFNKI